MVLALGTFLVNTTAIVSVPILITYVVENFTNRAAEVVAVLGLYKSIFGISLPFFMFNWQEAVGVGWLFGMMGFISILAFGLIVILIFYGHEIRTYTMAQLISTEEGMKIERVHAEKQAVDHQEVCKQEAVSC